MKLPSSEFIFLVIMVLLVASVYLTRNMGRIEETSSIRSECHSGLCTLH